MIEHETLIFSNLRVVLSEIESQPSLADQFSEKEMPFSELVGYLHEWIDEAWEYGIAYESIVCLLEKHTLSLSSYASVKLLEVGLLFRYKTELPRDSIYDFRND